MAKLKVKDIVKKYNLPARQVIAELKKEGVELKTASSSIPEDMLELVEEHFDALNAAKEVAQVADESNEEEGIHIKSPIIVKQLADTIGKKPNEIVLALMNLGVMASMNQTVDKDVAVKLCKEFGISLHVDKRDSANSQEEEEDDIEDEANLVERPPVVTFMGHVDHGKTSLQDAVRKTHVVKGEAGGITQHIATSLVEHNGQKIAFVDTPGHAAFSEMRKRGAKVTDIVILVIAADDGFKPQTVEAMNHALKAGVPIIVAINKMDLPAANPDKILLEMQQNELMSEDWGGDVGTVRVSAETGEGIDNLLDRILLEAEVMELKANPNGKVKATVIESQIETGFGATTNVIINNGTIKVGTALVCGEYSGKVRSLLDERDNKIVSAGPSEPVKIVGLNGAPLAGTIGKECKDEKEAKKLATSTISMNRLNKLSSKAGTTMEDLFDQMHEESKKELKVIIKADTQGSAEAIASSLNELPNDKVRIEIIQNTVGSITENDVTLASTSGAVLVGFHVKINTGVNQIAKKENVEIRLYSIIYELIADITEALEGKLDPTKREEALGEARILQVFKRTKGLNICGSYMESGYARVGSKARVIREGDIIFNGDVRSIRRFKDQVKEVKAGLECGILLDNFLDFEEGDRMQFYEVKLSKTKL